MNKTNRLVYLDILRILACLCILVIHFNATVSGYHTFGNFVYPNHILPNTYLGGVYLGHIGVGLFFIISGASLQKQYGIIPLNRKSILNFYKKRAMSLYPAFWIAWIIATVVSFFYYGSLPLAKLKSIFVSLVGLDGYLGFLIGKGGAFYQVGEWFLGCIIILYLLYPIIAYAANKYPVLAATGIFAVYYSLIDKMMEHWFIFQIPYLLLGIWFVQYCSKKYYFILSVVTLLLIIFRIVNGDTWQPLSVAIITCWGIFLLAERLINSVINYFGNINEKYLSIISTLSMLTYPAFLIHHKLIYLLSNRFDLSNFPYRNIVMLFIIYLFITFVLSWYLKKVSDKLSSIIKSYLFN